jgi:hypothetical protein
MSSQTKYGVPIIAVTRPAGICAGAVTRPAEGVGEAHQGGAEQGGHRDHPAVPAADERADGSRVKPLPGPRRFGRHDP